MADNNELFVVGAKNDDGEFIDSADDWVAGLDVLHLVQETLSCIEPDEMDETTRTVMYDCDLWLMQDAGECGARDGKWRVYAFPHGCTPLSPSMLRAL